MLINVAMQMVTLEKQEQQFISRSQAPLIRICTEFASILVPKLWLGNAYLSSA